MTQEELSLLDEREREAWELCQRVTWQGEEYLKARDLLPALLSKVVRLTQERDESFNEGIRVQTAFTNDQRRRAEAAESRISDLTKEKDSALQERDNFEQRLIKRGEAAKAIEAELEAAESRISTLTEELEQWKKAAETPANCPEWKCFHCGFGTSDSKEAAAHFGDRDDAEEFKPLCKWWQRMNDGERAETLQDTIQQLNDERDTSADAESERDRYKERVGELENALFATNTALKEMAEWHGGTHENDCPMDDTCNCKHKSFNQRVNGAINGAESALTPKENVSR